MGVACYAPTLVLFFIVACAPAPAEVPIDTATVEALATVTETREPTRTRLPTSTPTGTSTPYPTPSPLPIDFPDNLHGGWEFSPDEEWIAWITLCSHGPCLLVEQINGSLNWQVEFDFVSANWDGSIIPVHWSGDEHHLYYGVSQGGSGGYYFSYNIIGRLDLRTGKITELFPNADSISYHITLPPSSDTLVYILSSDEEFWLNIRDLRTGVEQSIEIVDLVSRFAGAFSWSEDETKLAFAVFSADGSYSFSVVLIDLTTLTNKIVFQSTQADISEIIWIDDENLLIYTYSGIDFRLNLTNNEFILSTPQP